MSVCEWMDTCTVEPSLTGTSINRTTKREQFFLWINKKETNIKIFLVHVDLCLGAFA